jgi:hypothetical protein
MYNILNTLIIDDTPEKMVNNPLQCVFITKTWKQDQINDNALLPGGQIYERLSNY